MIRVEEKPCRQHLSQRVIKPTTLRYLTEKSQQSVKMKMQNSVSDFVVIILG